MNLMAFLKNIKTITTEEVATKKDIAEILKRISSLEDICLIYELDINALKDAMNRLDVDFEFVKETVQELQRDNLTIREIIKELHAKKNNSPNKSKNIQNTKVSNPTIFIDTYIPENDEEEMRLQRLGFTIKQAKCLLYTIPKLHESLTNLSKKVTTKEEGDNYLDIWMAVYRGKRTIEEALSMMNQEKKNISRPITRPVRPSYLH